MSAKKEEKQRKTPRVASSFCTLATRRRINVHELKFVNLCVSVRAPNVGRICTTLKLGFILHPSGFCAMAISCYDCEMSSSWEELIKMLFIVVEKCHPNSSSPPPPPPPLCPPSPCPALFLRAAVLSVHYAGAKWMRRMIHFWILTQILISVQVGGRGRELENLFFSAIFALLFRFTMAACYKKTPNHNLLWHRAAFSLDSRQEGGCWLSCEKALFYNVLISRSWF